MTTTNSIAMTALLPMRHYSERVPGKNYRSFAGKPLYQHQLETLLQIPAINQVIINTDSPIIKEQVESSYPQVMLLDRPEQLRDPAESMNSIIAHDLEYADTEWVVQTHSTSPLLQKETYQRAIQKLQQDTSFDSLFGVTRLQTRLYDHQGAPINHDPAELLRTQDLPPVYEENSAFYFFTKTGFKKHHNRIGQHPYLFEIPALEAVDIDYEEDFQLAECLYQTHFQTS
jgi:CMP-N-acetylneuraminic acid synthetase